VSKDRHFTQPTLTRLIIVAPQIYFGDNPYLFNVFAIFKDNAGMSDIATINQLTQVPVQPPLSWYFDPRGRITQAMN